MKIRFNALVIVSILLLGFGMYVIASHHQSTTSSTNLSQTITYQGVEGKSALDLLKANHQVTSSSYTEGQFVDSIDGVTPDQNHFWSFSVNGQMSQVAADAYQTKAGDIITWQLVSLQ